MSVTNPKAGIPVIAQMAKLIGELLFAIVGSLIKDWGNSLFLKVGAWLDTRVHGRTTRIVVGLVLGLAAYFLVPIVIGLFSL
jgi:hypothetical protein